MLTLDQQISDVYEAFTEVLSIACTVATVGGTAASVAERYSRETQRLVCNFCESVRRNVWVGGGDAAMLERG